MGVEQIELDGRDMLQGLPPRMQQLMRHRKKLEEQTGLRYPMGGYCAICSRLEERVFNQSLEVCEQHLERLKRHADVRVRGKIIFWQRNPTTWKKIVCDFNCGYHHILYQIEFRSCVRCSGKIAQAIRGVKKRQ